MYLALKDLIQGITHKVYIVRSTVEVRPVGFLPGELEEKLDPYEQPYADICSELTERENAYQNLKDKGHLQFVSTSFLRGVTFNDCIVIVDEAQNMTFQELDTVSTRVGKNCRIMFCSDQAQSDLQTAKEKSGLPKFAAILKLMESVLSIEFGVEDIVRSGFVKEYLLAKMAIPST
jgi:predicted ribonuclease YlaK